LWKVLLGFSRSDVSVQIVLAALVKGAPETIQEFLSVVPEGYEETYKAAARRGGRVIALAYKKMTGDVSNETLHKLHRQEVESDLTFCGFMVFECPLKEDSALAISALHDSSHEVRYNSKLDLIFENIIIIVFATLDHYDYR
jgi:magnesium-transporting ATPase (P-type)